MALEPMTNTLQNEVDVFRSYKLCDIEFTRYAFQIMMEEAHRQAMQTMVVMYLSSPHCRYSHRREELVIAHKGRNTDNRHYFAYYDKLMRNN